MPILFLVALLSVIALSALVLGAIVWIVANLGTRDAPRYSLSALFAMTTLAALWFGAIAWLVANINSEMGQLAVVFAVGAVVVAVLLLLIAGAMLALFWALVVSLGWVSDCFEALSARLGRSSRRDATD